MTGDKRQILNDIIKNLNSVVIGLSGGVDSTLITKLCIDILGVENVWIVTGDSESIPIEELNYCKDIISQLKIPADHFTVIKTEELNIPDYKANPEDRCYHCKKELFSRLKEKANKMGAEHIIDGSNASDLDDYRPGLRAGKELKLRSPFAEADLTKDDIRTWAKELDLPNWDKPAMPCLSSRIPYHSEITPEKLDQVARAERLLRTMGFKQLRVRHHGQIARLELDDMKLLMKNGLMNKINSELKKLGFTYITVDLEGFHSGSLNAAIKEKR